MIPLPDSFERRMKVLLGTQFPAFRDSLATQAPQSIRINPKKVRTRPLLENVPYCSTGYYLPERPLYTLDPLLHAGAYYVQEASSMFLEQFFLPLQNRKLRVLDLCGAPGGKSTHLATLLSDESLLVSNEVIHSRAQILSENLKKWGNPNVVVTCNDPKDFARLPGYFDIIVVDAPCSGEGLFRRDPTAIDEWSESNANLCAQRQKRILADVWPALAENGMLVYSTCTFNPAENEENIRWLSEFTAVEPVSIDLPDRWGILPTNPYGLPGYRFYPHRVKGEGFFTAAVRKKEAAAATSRGKSKSSLLPAGKAEAKLLGNLLADPRLSLVKFGESWLAFPGDLLPELDLLKASLRLVQAGVKVGELIRDSVVPAHELALSTRLNQAHFPKAELSHEQAIAYLKKEEVGIDFQEKGWNLLTYRDHPLGWAKNMGNRYNNSYPKEWRIRMATNEFTREKLNEEAQKFPLERYEL